MRRLAPILLATFVVTACQDGMRPTAPDSSTFDPAQSAQAGGAQLADYIVVFNDDVADPAGLARGLVNQHGGTLGFTYEAALKGFSASLPPQAIEALQNNPNVAYIEADQMVTIVDTQSGATWGLDRVDQRNLPLDGGYTYNSDASGVRAYIIDTGISLSHNDFGGRALDGYDAVDGSLPAADCHGHGTHVAGTVGGTTWGVAKGVTLYAVRVLNCAGSGTSGGVIAGIDWVTANHVAPAVANMSLGGGYSQALNDAVTNSIAAGVTYAVAAGNENTNACVRSPASTPNALTVGSTTISDNRSSFSNYGTCVDLFAPGSSITSAWWTSNTATNTISGTSMAAPHVAGAAALYLAQNTGSTPAQVASGLLSSATPGVVGNPGTGSPNLLLYSLFGGSPPPPPPPPGDVHVTAQVLQVYATGNKRRKGNAEVQVLDATTGAPIPGAMVSGRWSGPINESDSGGPTDGSGQTTVQSSTTRAGGDFAFCIDDVTGDNLIYDGGADDCDTDPPPPPPTGSPTDLSVRYKTNGKNPKVTLTWSGGSALVDIYKGVALAASGESNDGNWSQPFDGQTNHVWKVCNAGSTTECDTAP